MDATTLSRERTLARTRLARFAAIYWAQETDAATTRARADRVTETCSPHARTQLTQSGRSKEKPRRHGSDTCAALYEPCDERRLRRSFVRESCIRRRVDRRRSASHKGETAHEDFITSRLEHRRGVTHEVSHQRTRRLGSRLAVRALQTFTSDEPPGTTTAEDWQSTFGSYRVGIRRPDAGPRLLLRFTREIRFFFEGKFTCNSSPRASIAS